MRYHRRRRRGAGRAVGMVLLVLVVLAGLGAGALFAAPLITEWLAPVPVSVQPQGVVKGLVVPTDGTLFAAETEAARAQQMGDVVQYAAQQGFNALFVQAAAPAAEAKNGYHIFYRDRAFATYPALTAEDGFFHKPDALKALCELAAQQNMAVYALLPQGAAGSEALQKSMERLARRYAVAGVYATGETEGGIGALAGLGEAPPPALTYAEGAVWENPSALFLATVRDGFSGLALADYNLARQSPTALNLLLSALDDSVERPQWKQYTPAHTLGITYPQEGTRIATEQCFIMGRSDPAQPLTLNGAPVERTGKTGLFGVLVTLAQGENTFTFAQGAGQAHTLTLQYGSSGGGSGSSGSSAPKRDNTKRVPEGSYVKTTGWINSLLNDPSGDNNISETVREGTMARVVDCVETRRNGKITWAYQLASGDYVLAYNTAFVGSAPRAAYSGAQAAPNTGGTGEMLTFAGSGQPMVYANRVDNTLVLHLYDTDLPADFAVVGSGMVRAATASAQEEYTELVLEFDARLYGFDILFENGTLVLALKRTPVQSDVPGKPLQGVSVLLDPGHGADDMGAMGTAGSGENAPMEKDVNLAVSLAATYRLQQLGATVETVRTDDSFLSLQERNRLISTVQPDYFIAVHHNSIALQADANSATGVEAYYFYAAGQTLAQQLVTRVAAAAPRKERGAMWGYYYVARNTLCPAVLLEVGFMVNPAEYEQVTDEASIWATGDAIAMSVLDCTAKG